MVISYTQRERILQDMSVFQKGIAYKGLKIWSNLFTMSAHGVDYKQILSYPLFYTYARSKFTKEKQHLRKFY